MNPRIRQPTRPTFQQLVAKKMWAGSPLSHLSLFPPSPSCALIFAMHECREAKGKEGGDRNAVITACEIWCSVSGVECTADRTDMMMGWGEERYRLGYFTSVLRKATVSSSDGRSVGRQGVRSSVRQSRRRPRETRQRAEERQHVSDARRTVCFSASQTV